MPTIYNWLVFAFFKIELWNFTKIRQHKNWKKKVSDFCEVSSIVGIHIWESCSLLWNWIQIAFLTLTIWNMTLQSIYYSVWSPNMKFAKLRSAFRRCYFLPFHFFPHFSKIAILKLLFSSTFVLILKIAIPFHFDCYFLPVRNKRSGRK